MLARNLAQKEDIDVVGIAFNGLEAIKNIEKIKPDIIVMDIDLPMMNGFQSAKRIMREHPTPILFVSSTWDVRAVKVALQRMDYRTLAVVEKPMGEGEGNFFKQMNDLISHVRLLSQIKLAI